MIRPCKGNYITIECKQSTCALLLQCMINIRCSYCVQITGPRKSTDITIIMQTERMCVIVITHYQPSLFRIALKYNCSM